MLSLCGKLQSLEQHQGRIARRSHRFARFLSVSFMASNRCPVQRASLTTSRRRRKRRRKGENGAATANEPSFSSCPALRPRSSSSICGTTIPSFARCDVVCYRFVSCCLSMRETGRLLVQAVGEFLDALELFLRGRVGDRLRERVREGVSVLCAR